MLVNLVLSSFVLCFVIVVLGQDCTLDDVQSTKGTCQAIRNCKFAVNNLHADLQPKICSGRVVCCPIQETIAERKCNEWRSYLHTPLTFDPHPLPDPLCGVITPNVIGLITGGRTAEKYEFPHAVALGYGQKESELHYSCGGTLISDDFVLTAAHCVRTNRGSPMFALLGDITLSKPTSNFRQIVPISEIIVHPNYKPPLSYNDIALLKLKEKVELSRYLLPACLPRASETQSEIFDAIGWGTLGPGEPQSQYLQAVNLTLFKKKECDSFYADSADKSFRYPQGIKRTQMCAGDSNLTGKDTCNGDSGGPLSSTDLHNGKELRCLFRIVGITSFGSKLCGYGTPGVYTKVLSYVPWIEKIVFPMSTGKF